MKLYVVFLVTT